MVADPVLAGPVVGLGVADTGALVVVDGALADAGALAGAAGRVAAAAGLAAVTDLALADVGRAAVVVVVFAVTLADVDVTVRFWMTMDLASPLTSFFSAEAVGFLSAVPTVLVRVVAATFGDLVAAPTVEVLAAAVGPVVAGAFFAVGTVVVLAVVVDFAAGLVVAGLVAPGAFFAAPTVAGALAVLETELKAGSGVLGFCTITSSLVVVVVFSAAVSSITGLTSSLIGSSLTMVGAGSAAAGSFIGAMIGVSSGTLPTGASFSTTHNSSSTGT